jgi:signal transduction histidine kinase/CheY-like chemotaxis protein
MSSSILSVSIRSEYDTVAARQRARHIARLLGFDAQDQTRISTAVSEIARNAFNYARGGRVEYMLEGRTAPQLFVVKVTDSGTGIPNLQTILDGRYQSKTGMGMGILGARRLMDQFQIETAPGHGTTIWLQKLLPKNSPVLNEADLGRLAAKLALEAPEDAFHELQRQNQELLAALDEIQVRQEELSRLNRELEDTNRGMVALYAELDEKADHLRRADELKSRFFSNMSHEFRSPLNSILALTGLLLGRSDGPLSSEQDQQVGYVRKAAEDLLDLVNDLLDIAKLEAGKLEAKPVEFSAANLFAAMRGMLRPLLLNQSVDLTFDDVDNIPAFYSDEGKISQILRNFISNALKFTERGEVRVSANMDGSNHVVFSVSDTGIGIAPEDRERIFQDFTQVDSPIQRRYKGTGLGLPLSKKLAILLGGEVSVESGIGAGSTFKVRLPLQYRASGEPEAIAQPVRVVESDGRPLLIVEDSPEMILMYRSYLQGTGFQPIHAATTREARLILETVRPVAIVVDVVLRSEDSWGFLARLKGDEATKDIPVMVVSTIEDQAKAFHLGADDYLVKPLDPEVLIERLRILSGQPPARRLLIIDDNERDRYLLKQCFRDPTVRIVESSCASEGITQAGHHKPDLIVLDLCMPGMSGFAVLDQLKRNPATKGIPVVICTSLHLTDGERSQLMLDAAAILEKQHLDRVRAAQVLLQVFDPGVVAAVPTVGSYGS